MPKRAEPEPRKIAWRVPVVAGAGCAAGGGATGNARGAAAAAVEVGAGLTNGEAPPWGPRRILSSDAWYTAITTPHCGHLSLATSANPQRGQVSAIRPSRRRRARPVWRSWHRPGRHAEA